MLLGIDIGTSGAKAVLIRPDGLIVASGREEYPIESPHPGWAEQNPELWFLQAAKAVRAVTAGHRNDVSAIALSGQMHGITLIDGAGKPVRNAVIWADARSRNEPEIIAETVGPERILDITLNRVAAGYGLASLVWLRRHEPAALDKTRWLLCPKDYVRFRFTGNPGQEASDASSTCLMDIRRIAWATDMLHELGLPTDILPPISASTDLSGNLTGEAAALCGLPAGVPVYFGGADNPMAGIGAGLAREGWMGINIGTGGQAGTVAARPVFDKEYRTSTFCHPMPGKWTIFGATLAAGLALQWFRDAFYPGHTFGELSSLAEKARPGCGGLLFLPYLAGERTPWLDARARGVFFGLSLDHGAAELCRAVMEGVVFALVQSFDLILEAGVAPERVLSMGGGAKSSLWPQIQADMLGRPVQIATGGDACVGAAIVAGAGAGTYNDIGEGVREAVKLDGAWREPDPTAHAVYMEMKERFEKLYLNNSDLFATAQDDAMS